LKEKETRTSGSNMSKRIGARRRNEKRQKEKKKF